jgi:hypothetical protein
MRWLLGFVLLLLALGTLRTVGCGDNPCQNDADCDDQNECTDDFCSEQRCRSEPESGHGHPRRCDFDGVQGIAGEDGVCSEEGVCVPSPCDDGNECTDDDGPRDYDGACFNRPCTGCRPCDWEGEPGVCIEGVCVEDVCLSLVCDDGDPCTVDFCISSPSPLFVVGCNTSPKNCSDGNECTNDACEPETGDCVHEPVPDGESCCHRGGTCPGICIPGGCGWCCFDYGQCQNGACRADVGAFEVQP